MAKTIGRFAPGPWGLRSGPQEAAEIGHSAPEPPTDHRPKHQQPFADNRASFTPRPSRRPTPTAHRPHIPRLPPVDMRFDLVPFAARRPDRQRPDKPTADGDNTEQARTVGRHPSSDRPTAHGHKERSWGRKKNRNNIQKSFKQLKVSREGPTRPS